MPAEEFKPLTAFPLGQGLLLALQDALKCYWLYTDDEGMIEETTLVAHQDGDATTLSVSLTYRPANSG